MALNKRFTIQKHEAVALHYMINFETKEGTFSWTIPNGPSQDPRVVRLAFRVVNQVGLDFEGIDTENDLETEERRRVIVWDSGTYSTFELDGEPLSASDSIQNGQIELNLSGKKIRGRFTLLRIESEPNERWVLMKAIDEHATSRRDPVAEEPDSVFSGKSLEEMTEEY